MGASAPRKDDAMHASRRQPVSVAMIATAAFLLALVFHPALSPAQPAAGRRPNIVVFMGDDVGWFNLSCYHQGIMSSRTPNLDRLAAAGMRFTDYYSEASCTA